MGATITIASLDEAAGLLRQAKSLETSAKTYREAARQYIIDHAGADEAGWEKDPNGEKTILYPVPEIGTIALTRPTTKPIPARFDAARTDEFYELIADAFPEALDLAFETKTVTVRTFSEAGYLAAVKQQPHLTNQMHQALAPFVLPAEEGTAMSPRVEIK